MHDQGIDIEDLRRKVGRLKAMLLSHGDDAEALDAIKELTQEVRSLLDRLLSPDP